MSTSNVNTRDGRRHESPMTRTPIICVTKPERDGTHARRSLSINDVTKNTWIEFKYVVVTKPRHNDTPVCKIKRGTEPD